MQNGQREPLMRYYNSLKNFIGENKVYRCGDVLCVSTRNNDRYDKFIYADGVSTFRELYKEETEDGEYGYVKVRVD